MDDSILRREARIFLPVLVTCFNFNLSLHSSRLLVSIHATLLHTLHQTVAHFDFRLKSCRILFVSALHALVLLSCSGSLSYSVLFLTKDQDHGVLMEQAAQWLTAHFKQPWGVSVAVAMDPKEVASIAGFERSQVEDESIQLMWFPVWKDLNSPNGAWFAFPATHQSTEGDSHF